MSVDQAHPPRSTFFLTRLHHRHAVAQGTITNMMDEQVVQPMLVTSSAITLATETVRMILKIDDIVPTR